MFLDANVQRTMALFHVNYLTALLYRKGDCNIISDHGKYNGKTT